MFLLANSAHNFESDEFKSKFNDCVEYFGSFDEPLFVPDDNVLRAINNIDDNFGVAHVTPAIAMSSLFACPCVIATHEIEKPTLYYN